MSGGYHAWSMTDGVPVRSMREQELVELALQLEPPWRVVSSDFDFARRRVDLRVGFRAGSRFPCPQYGRSCQAVEFAEGTWRQPDVMAFEAFVTARLPSVRCPEHGDVAFTPSWASDHVSLRALVRDRNQDHLGDTSAHPGSRHARPTSRRRASREVDHASELALGDRERAQGNVKLVSDQLSRERSLHAEAAVDASQRETTAPAAHASGLP